jgi:predicted NAD/FAD-dependent oxidoreductase
MPTSIKSPRANEEGTYVITAVFKDHDGNLVAPITAKWTLTDPDGAVINSRNEVVISSPASSEQILLTADDLATISGNIIHRILTIEATYNSTLGSNLPLNESVSFIIDNLIKI